MGVLEQISQMKNQGMQNNDIVATLQQQGISPKAINDALSQADIKKAVSAEGPQQDIVNQAPRQDQGQYIAKTQEVPNEVYAPQTQSQGYSSEGYYPQQGYDQYSGSQGGLNVDSSTIIEISEQVFSEKIRKIEKQIKEVVEFKTISESTLNNLVERVKRMESMIDKLQISILDKVGSYGKNMDHLKKEVSMVQDSFRKMVNPIANRANQKVSETHKKSSSTKTGKASKK